MNWFTKETKCSPEVSMRIRDRTDDMIRIYERALEDKDEVIEFLRVELAASRDREGWYQQRFQEERDRSNTAADVLIVENGRRPLTHISDAIMQRDADAAKRVAAAQEEEDPFETFPIGDPRGSFATAEEAQDGYAGEV